MRAKPRASSNVSSGFVGTCTPFSSRFLRLEAEFRPLLSSELPSLLRTSGSGRLAQLDGHDIRNYLTDIFSQFGELPELPNRTKNLSLGDIMKITVTFPSAQTSSETTDKAQPRIISLPQAVSEERAWLLIGDGGEGKTTALYYLAHHFAGQGLASETASAESACPTPIPVYVPLRRDGSTLDDQIWTALQRQHFHCSRETLDAWIAHKPFLFLIDRLEETDPRITLENLRDLMRRAPNARLVIASRPHISVTCPWPQARIQPPSDAALRGFLSRLLGPARGAEVFDLLLQGSLIDPFRRPLFARFLALTSPELLDEKRFTLAEIFRDVIEGRFLGQWEGPSESELEGTVMRDLLAFMAHEMVRDDIAIVARQTALQLALKLAAKHRLTADARTAEALLDLTIKHGLISEGHAGLQFWHSSFRDYFAAVWLEQTHAAALLIYARTWQPRWAECLLFYYGFLRGTLLEKRLQQLLIGLPLIIRVLSLNPAPAALTIRLILILRVLVQARETRGPWRQRFIRLLPSDGRLLFLQGFSSPREYSHTSVDDEDRIHYFFDLIGQLAIPEAFEYLRFASMAPYCGVTWVAAGLIRSPDDRDLEFLASSIPTDFSHPLVTHLFLTSLQPRCSRLIHKLVDDRELRAKTLKSLKFAMSLYGEKDEEGFRTEFEHRWTPLLIGFALHDDDQQIRRAAVEFLQYFGRHSFLTVPKPAHEAFIRALDDPAPDMRRRALDGLNCPALSRHMDIVWHLLDDDSYSIVSSALFNFRMCAEPKRFTHAVLKVLRRCAVKGSLLRNTYDTIISEFREHYDRPVHVPLRSVVLLTSALFAAPFKGLQTNAMYALDIIHADDAAPFFIDLVSNDLVSGDARSIALWAVVKRLHAEARAVVLSALEDKSPRVREAAASICYSEDFGEEFRPICGPILFTLLEDDDLEVRRTASYALKKYRYLDKGWMPDFYRNPAYPKLDREPVYLGPPAPDEHLTFLDKPVNPHYLQQSRQKEALPHIEPPDACS